MSLKGDRRRYVDRVLERAFGALLPAVLRLLGVSKLQGRADLHTLISHLVGLGL